MQFTVEEENLICMYHKSDRRRTAANIRAALPDMDEDIRHTNKRQCPVAPIDGRCTLPGRWL